MRGKDGLDREVIKRMPKIITLDRIKIQNIQIFEQFDIEDGQPRWALVLSYRMVNSRGENLAANRTFDLNLQQRFQLRSFLEEFIDTLITETNIVDVENWIKSDKVESESNES